MKNRRPINAHVCICKGMTPLTTANQKHTQAQDTQKKQN